MERLTEYMGNREDYESINPIDTPYEYGKANLQALINKLAAYEDAEEQGWLLRLPCKVGDTVYAFLSTCNYFTECQINKIELKPTLYGNTCYFLEPIGHRGCLYRCFEDDFGKTVFLTKEEAEAKLKEMIQTDADKSLVEVKRQ